MCPPWWVAPSPPTSTPCPPRSRTRRWKKRARLPSCLDFLRYIGTPEVVEAVVNELGSFAPTLIGTEPVAGLEAFAEQANQGLRVVNIGSSSASLDPNFQKNFGLYMSGNMDLDQTTQLIQSELDRAVQDYKTTNPDIDIESCMAG